MEVWVLPTAPVAPTFILSRALKPVWSLYVLLVDSDTLCPISSQVSVSFFGHCSVFLCNQDCFGSRIQCNRLMPPWHINFKLDMLQQAVWKAACRNTCKCTRVERLGAICGQQLPWQIRREPFQLLFRICSTHLQNSLFVHTREMKANSSSQCSHIDEHHII